MKTIILGKESVITKALEKKINDCDVFSTRKIDNIAFILNKIHKYKKFNIVFNNFYPTLKISSINEDTYEKFYDQSINFNSRFLSLINKKKINKIIYQSSSSVYNSISHNFTSVDGLNRKLLASTKISNESLIHNFCSKNNIIYVITRIFNMYGFECDQFSMVSKIVESFKKRRF